MFGKTRTVAGILSRFRKTVEELRAHATEHADLIDNRKKLIADIEEANDFSAKEHALAHAAADRIEHLIGVQ